MGKLQNNVAAWTEGVEASYTNGGVNKAVGNVIGTTTDVQNIAQNAVLLTLSKAWIGIGMINPAETDKFSRDKESVWKRIRRTEGEINSPERMVDRYDYEKLWSLQLGDYFMPLSQTFTLRAKKRMNISSLVDGIDIIQQTRKEAKTVDCVLRIALNENQTNLHLVNANEEIQQLAQFLADLYETDAVFAISNDTINNTFGVTHVMLTEYKFIPRTGMGTYTFEFSLMEVKYEDNVLTFDLRQVNDGTQGQIQ